MVVVHKVFRRELALIPRLVRAVAPGDTRRAAVVAGHARLVLGGLDMHHTGEDALLWPKLLERDAPDSELIHRMEAQHHRVEELIASSPMRIRVEADRPVMVTGADHDLDDAAAVRRRYGNPALDVGRGGGEHLLQPVDALGQPAAVPGQDVLDLGFAVRGEHGPDLLERQVDSAEGADQPSIAELVG